MADPGDFFAGTDPSFQLQGFQQTKLQELGYPLQVIAEITEKGSPDLVDRITRGGWEYGSNDAAFALDNLGIDRPDYTTHSETGEVYIEEGSGAARGEPGRWNEGPQWSPSEQPVAPPEQLPVGDILREQMAHYLEGMDPMMSAALGYGEDYGEALNELASNYSDTVRNSSGYKGLKSTRDEFRGIYDQGGLTDMTRAGLEKARSDEDQWIRAQREAQLQDLAERGMSGGGMEVAGSIGDRARAADRMSSRNLETLSFAQQQAMNALEQAGRYNRDILRTDEGLADTELQYGTKGADTIYDINDTFMNNALDFYGYVERGGVDSSQQGWKTAADGASGASQVVAQLLKGATGETRAQLISILNDMGVKIDDLGVSLSTGDPHGPPDQGHTPNPGEPVSQTAPPVGDIAEGAVEIATGLVPDDDDDGTVDSDSDPEEVDTFLEDEFGDEEEPEDWPI